MPTNDFKAFATGGGANVESQATYVANPQLGTGNQPGVASSAFVNKSLRQACWIASVLAQFLCNTTGNDVLDDANSSNLLATMALAWPNSTLPTRTVLTTTGTTAGYLFTVSSANATAGATYTNNGHTYTVLSTLASGTQLFCSQAAAPQASGTLTKATGTGDATITFSANVPLAVYTPPANTKFLKVMMAGGGGGGAGSGGGGNGVAGTATAFGAGLMICQGGSGGTYSSAGTQGGAGGTASLGSGPVGVAIQGGAGGGSVTNGISGACGGSPGGVNPFGGGSGSGAPNTGGATTAVANTGAGGGSGGSASAATPASGGGAGGYIDALITTLAASYYYCIGSGGAAGSTAGGNGAASAGASGIIVVEEHYTG